MCLRLDGIAQELIVIVLRVVPTQKVGIKGLNLLSQHVQVSSWQLLQVKRGGNRGNHLDGRNGGGGDGCGGNGGGGC